MYYPRVMMRTLAQVLTEEYSEHGIHVANIIIDGLIDSPGTRALLPLAQQRPEVVMDPVIREDRGGIALLLSTHPRQILLDARTPIDSIFDQGRAFITIKGRQLRTAAEGALSVSSAY